MATSHSPLPWRVLMPPCDARACVCARASGTLTPAVLHIVLKLRTEQGFPLQDVSLPPKFQAKKRSEQVTVLHSMPNLLPLPVQYTSGMDQEDASEEDEDYEGGGRPGPSHRSAGRTSGRKRKATAAHQGEQAGCPPQRVQGAGVGSGSGRASLRQGVARRGRPGGTQLCCLCLPTCSWSTALATDL